MFRQILLEARAIVLQQLQFTAAFWRFIFTGRLDNYSVNRRVAGILSVRKLVAARTRQLTERVRAARARTRRLRGLMRRDDIRSRARAAQIADMEFNFSEMSGSLIPYIRVGGVLTA